MPKYTTVATCALAQWALDFSGNLQRIKESIRIAKSLGAKFRSGPELEICGYSCEDHFFEEDTIQHCWECLRDILRTDLTDNILCDIGMPVVHENVRYNCRVVVLNKKVIMIRPKICLADEGNYRESRWFAGWTKGFHLFDFTLPRIIREASGQTRVKIGLGAIALADTMVGSETCEELFTPDNPGIALGLGGIEILANGSGSHHSLGRMVRRLELIMETTRKNGGLYLYANQQGCDGSRLYFDGAAIIVMNGKVLAQGTQFSMKDVEVVTASVDLTDVHNYRTSIASRGVQAARATALPRVDVDWYLCDDLEDLPTHIASPVTPLHLNSAEEEIAYGPSCWMWDYLRRSGLQGFFVPLSGGKDSAATTALVGIMCQLLFQVIRSQDGSQTLQELRRCVKDPLFDPQSCKDIATRILYTCYMSTPHSTKETQERARALALDIGANFDVVSIEPMIAGAMTSFAQLGGPNPDIGVLNSQQNIACQNVQARCRMVFSYLCAQLNLWRKTPSDPWPGTLLVLGSSNLDEALRGYFTKYDCSSADINPIGALSKSMIHRFLVWAARERNMPSLTAIVESKSSAELQPMINGHQDQDSQEEMGLSFDELEVFGKLRIYDRCGPLSMYRKVSKIWHSMDPLAVAEKVKRFFHYYAINRHKMTTLTPSYHLENYSPDDNRYDLRQFLYDASWKWQFEAIDRQIQKEAMKKRSRESLQDVLHERVDFL